MPTYWIRQKHAERHADRRVEVGGGHRAQMLDAEQLAGGGQRIHRQDVHEIFENTMQKIVMASGAMNLFVAVKGVLHHAVDEFHQISDGGLQFARHAAGGARARPQR